MFTRSSQLFIPPSNRFARKLINCQLISSLFLFRLNLRRFCTVRLHKWDCKLYAVLEGNQLGDGFLLPPRRFKPPSIFFVRFLLSKYAAGGAVCWFPTKTRRNCLKQYGMGEDHHDSRLWLYQNLYNMTNNFLKVYIKIGLIMSFRNNTSTYG